MVLDYIRDPTVTETATNQHNRGVICGSLSSDGNSTLAMIWGSGDATGTVFESVTSNFGTSWKTSTAATNQTDFASTILGMCPDTMEFFTYGGLAAMYMDGSASPYNVVTSLFSTPLPGPPSHLAQYDYTNSTEVTSLNVSFQNAATSGDIIVAMINDTGVRY